MDALGAGSPPRGSNCERAAGMIPTALFWSAYRFRPGQISLVCVDAERVRGEERPGVVLLEVEPPDAVAPAKRAPPPVEGNFGIGAGRANIRPGLPGVDGRVADGRVVRVRRVA